MDHPGQTVSSPWRLPLRIWFAAAKRTWAEASEDNIGLIAAGVAFYGFLALVPLIGATALVYGLIASPDTVAANMAQLASIMPDDIARLIGEQLLGMVQTPGTKKGLGLVIALGAALFGARNGAGAMIMALNIAYEETEKRGFVRLNLLAIGMTAGAVAVAVLAMIAIAALGHLQRLLPAAPDVLVAGGKIAAYLMLTLAGAAGAATLYRYAPCRADARWKWITPGSILAAALGPALTFGFGIYATNFGNYNGTYGSLGAVVATLTWLYLSSYILLFGAELNCEIERLAA